MKKFSTKQGFMFYFFPIYEEKKEKNSKTQLLWICTNIFEQSSAKQFGAISNNQKSGPTLRVHLNFATAPIILEAL